MSARGPASGGLCARRAAAARRAAMRRSRSRGALVVEAIFTITIVAMTLATTLLFHGSYGAALETLHESRLRAWQRALPGCPLEGAGELTTQSASSTHAPEGNGWLGAQGAIARRLSLTCNEPPSEASSFSTALDQLHRIAAWRPFDMARWLFGGGVLEEFGGALGFVTQWVDRAAGEIRRLGSAAVDATDWVRRAVGHALDWFP